MNIEINERELVENAVAKLLSPSRLEALAVKAMQTCSLLTVKDVCHLLKISDKAFRKLGVPCVFLGENKRRYRLCDLSAHLEKHLVHLQ